MLHLFAVALQIHIKASKGYFNHFHSMSSSDSAFGLHLVWLVNHFKSVEAYSTKRMCIKCH